MWWNSRRTVPVSKGRYHQGFAFIMSANLEDSAVPQDWKRSILIPITKKGSTKECANHQTIALISHASKLTLKILHVRLQHYTNQELPDVQAGFRKGIRTRNEIANTCWIIEKARKFQKNVSVSLTTIKPWQSVESTQRDGNTRPTYLSPEKPVCGSKKEQLEPCMKQLTGSRSRKEYNRSVCCHPVCLIYTWSTSWKMLGWMSYKLESR